MMGDLNSNVVLDSSKELEIKVIDKSDKSDCSDVTISNTTNTATTTTIRNNINILMENNSMQAECKDSESDSRSKSLPKVFKSFEERLEELKSYNSQYGHCRVPSKFESNPSMAAWCANLKQSYRLLQEGKKPILKLSQEKIDALETVGFEWKYSGRSQKSNTLNSQSQSQSLSNIKTENNVQSPSQIIDTTLKVKSCLSSVLPHCSIINITNEQQELKLLDNDEPISSSEEKPIVSTRSGSKRIEEMKHTNSKKTTTVARKERMKPKSFEERLEELKEYKAKHGHCRVSRNDTNHFSLGKWCHNMRGSYRANQKKDNNEKNPILLKNRIDMLNDISFDWTLKEPRQMKSFDERLDDLKEFKEMFGHTRVPSGYPKNLSLAYWCNNLRNAYKMKKTGKKQYIALNQERLDALEEIGFEFSKKSLKNDDPCSFEDDKCEVANELVVGLEGGVGPILYV